MRITRIPACVDGGSAPASNCARSFKSERVTSILDTEVAFDNRISTAAWLAIWKKMK